MNYAFVILHYKAIEATIKCVNSIVALDVPDGSSLLAVVVDNGSADGSYERLRELFSSDERVVVTTRENLGFARGNNFGLNTIRQLEDPDYVIATNNDVVIPSKGFLNEIVRLQNETGFAVLGPDVYNPYTHEHQSPCGPGLVTTAQVDKMIARNRRGLQRLQNLHGKDRVYLTLRDSRFGDLLAALKHRGLERVENSDWESRQRNLVLQGSFLVFSRRWFQEFPFLFYPKTFMYLEENFLQLLALQHGLALVYDPSIQIHHLHGVATRIGRSKWSDRQLFYYKNILDSLSAYNELFHGFTGDDKQGSSK
jgi:GT2 family glycosyltransferase